MHSGVETWPRRFVLKGLACKFWSHPPEVDIALLNHCFSVIGFKSARPQKLSFCCSHQGFSSAIEAQVRWDLLRNNSDIRNCKAVMSSRCWSRFMITFCRGNSLTLKSSYASVCSFLSGESGQKYIPVPVRWAFEPLCAHMALAYILIRPVSTPSLHSTVSVSLLLWRQGSDINKVRRGFAEPRGTTCAGSFHKMARRYCQEWRSWRRQHCQTSPCCY